MRWPKASILYLMASQKEQNVRDIGAWKMLRISAALPLLVLAFYAAAPYWLNAKLRSQVREDLESKFGLSAAEREQRLAAIAKLDFRRLCEDHPPEYQRVTANLENAGVCGNFARLRWGGKLSIGLVGLIAAATASMLALNRWARSSPNALIRGYRLGWTVAMTASTVQLLLLIPLLIYGIFEFGVLLANRFSPTLLIAIALGGGIALFGCMKILFRKVPLQFQEPMSREITPQESPELWETVRVAAQRLGTTPPDRIIVGMKPNFYVTELAVAHGSGRTEGRTLFLSHTLLKLLSEEEILSIIGHELGHFIGDDTRLTREFYPLRHKVLATLAILSHSGVAGITSGAFLSFFGRCFAETEQRASRSRELLADQQGGALVSPRTLVRALVKLQASVEALSRELVSPADREAPLPLDQALAATVREKLVHDSAFWSELLEKQLPHPLDSHPPLHERVEALGERLTPEGAQAIAAQPTGSAYDAWFAGRDDLFSEMTNQARAEVSKIQARAQIVNADYRTEAGKTLLDRHFPEITWRNAPSGVDGTLIALAVLSIASVAGVILIPDPGAKVAVGLLGFILGALAAFRWTSTRNIYITLNAEGLIYNRWNRPLRFADVVSMSAQKHHSELFAKFRLKPGQAPYSKLAWGQQKELSISLKGLSQSPNTVLQTIFRYVTRQADAAPAARNDE